jgi:hypothetical protein
MKIEEKVLQNLMEDMQKEVDVWEEIYGENKDEDFYNDYANISYTLYLNGIARIKEVLFRMSINNKESA